jgi:rod shape determining protein RodA
MRFLRNIVSGLDPWLFGAALVLSLLGLSTMYTFQGDSGFFSRQIIWIIVGIVAMLLALIPDYRFLRSGHTTFIVYLLTVLLLVLVLFIGEVTLGAKSRFDLGPFSFQPAEFAKLVLIAVLAKYFSKRHEMIGDFKHILISGFYTFAIFALVFIQPDFGSSLIILSIWLGMVLIAGIRLWHLLFVIGSGVMVFLLMWSFVLMPYQKDRVMTFIDPLADIQGAGYNVYQSIIAVGSGQLWGKGVGYGTQSKMEFLPEHETDFIFAAFAEEWGLIGALILFTLYGVVVWRLVRLALNGATNFERLFAVGVAIFVMAHFTVHVGMNIGLMPVTGLTIPFMSYGGTHLLVEFIALGVVMAMSRYTMARYKSEDILLS